MLNLNHALKSRISPLGKRERNNPGHTRSQKCNLSQVDNQDFSILNDQEKVSMKGESAKKKS